MSTAGTLPAITICVLTHADYPLLARQCVDSIVRNCERSQYRLVVGANSVGAKTLDYLHGLKADGAIDHLIESPTNLGKCPMMRRMFKGIETEFVWWFDDDSYITEPAALAERLRIARSAIANIVMWGKVFQCEHPKAFWDGDPVEFVRSATWYRGLTPPFWEPGGKGELDFNGQGTGDGRWLFIVGGGWFIRTSAIKQLDWPDPRLHTLGDDVFLGEAIRQRGWEIQEIGDLGVAIDTAPRRWSPPLTV